jgi:eukaryotic-like serine/threonine-protein kinase
MAPPAARYRELHPLAEGGMAVLCLGESDEGARVVIKRIRPPFEHDPAFRALFEDEGSVAACLCGERFVALLDKGCDEVGPYLVFEHVDGTDLGVVLEARAAAGGALDLPAFFAVALPLCEALHEAHETRGADGEPLDLVHRDVSPGNVLLSLAGAVKLADFGVASSRLKTNETIAGEMKGKFAYMAPEQTRGEPAQRAADVFAAGVVLWECLCGERLFDGPTDADVVHAVRTLAAPAPATKNPEAPAELTALLLRMLEKEPAARPADLHEVRAALLEVAQAYGLERGGRAHIARLARTYPRPSLAEHPHVAERRRRTQRVLQAPGRATGRQGPLWPLLLLAGIAAAVGAGAWLWRAEAPAPAPRAQPLLVEAAPVPAPAPPAGPAPVAMEVPAAALPPRAVATKRAPPARQEQPRRRAPPKEPAVPAAARGFGLLSLDTDPWSNVTIDGEPLGQPTPLLKLRLPAGRHELLLENPVYGLVRKVTVDIEPAQETRRFVDLTTR